MGLSSEGETVYNPETIRWLNPILDDENLEEERILAYKEKRRERYKNSSSTSVRSWSGKDDFVDYLYTKDIFIKENWK